MRNAIIRVAVGAIAAVMLFAFWTSAVWLDSLMTMRTPLYFQFHSAASMIVSPLFGVLIGLMFEP